MSKILSDDSLLPGQRPASRTRLQEMLEGQQIGRATSVDLDPIPGFGFALELTTSARLLVVSRRNHPRPDLPFRWVLRFEFFPPQKIQTKSMDAHFRREQELEPGAPAPHPTLKKLEGEVIRGVVLSREPNEARGEQCALELASGMRLGIWAVPPSTGANKAEVGRVLLRPRWAAKPVLFLPNGAAYRGQKS